MDEDWAVLTSFLPECWRELASETGALKGLRKDKPVESVLRVLLLHVGCGRSLRESVVRAKMAGLADVSAVALMKRLKKSKDWLHALCGDDGAKAWLYGKRLVALLVEKLARHAVAVSPRGCHLDTAKAAQPVA